MSYRVDEAGNMEELMRMMRAEDARIRGESTTGTPQVEQDTLEKGDRQIAHPTKVDSRAQMDDNIKHGHKTIEEQAALKADAKTVFAAEHAEQHSNKPRGQHFGVSVGRGGVPAKQPQQAADPLAGLDPFEIHGANGAFVDAVVNPENDRLARAHTGFHQKLAENKVVGRNKDVDEQFFDATEEARMQAEFFPEEVQSGPTGVWDTSGLEANKQVTATMVNPLLDDEDKA